jgi:anti-sigma factor RsiW
MPEVDSELETLDAFIDGELSAGEVETLRRRLEAEPELAAELEAMRADRTMRTALWASYAPTEAQVGRLIDRVDHAIDRQTVWSYRLSRIRVGSAAAACILLGLLIGRVTFGTRGTALPISGATAAVPSAGVTTVNNQLPLANPNPPVQFRIVDGNGQPITNQPFNSVEEAKQFLEDLNQWQKQQEQIKSGGGQVPSTEHF